MMECTCSYILDITGVPNINKHIRESINLIILKTFLNNHIHFKDCVAGIVTCEKKRFTIVNELCAYKLVKNEFDLTLDFKGQSYPQIYRLFYAVFDYWNKELKWFR